MCEAIVFMASKGDEKEVMREVVTLEVDNDRLLLGDILGETVELKGKIKNIDFLKHQVVVEEI
jgi:predicted RNA-binding protein